MASAAPAPKGRRATKATVQTKIRQQVNKQVAKKFSGATKAATSRGKAQRAVPVKKVNTKANNMGQGKLKISFNPGSLKSTTDKTVSAQIFGAMSRGKNFGGNGPTNNNNNNNNNNKNNNKKPTKQNSVKGKGGSSVVVVKR